MLEDLKERSKDRSRFFSDFCFVLLKMNYPAQIL
jgi:hypothetical protein